MKSLLAAWVLLLAGAAHAADTYNLPDLGDASAAILTPGDERRLGEEFMRTARRSLDILDEPELTAYIQDVGGRLVRHLDQPAGQFQFFIVKDSQINAFAVPGGYVGVNTGLILAARNEAELASVLAHEIAHITQRHIPRMIAESERSAGPAMAALLAAIILAGSGHQGGEAAIALTSATLAQQQLNFTRAYEQEADRIGMGILDAADYDARAMPAFFERMLAATRLYESDLPEFLRTHPVTTRRIAESKDHADAFPHHPPHPAADFEHAQALIRVLMAATAQEAVAALRPTGTQADNDANRYGYALALQRSGDTGAARAEITRLLKKHPGYLWYRIALAEIQLDDGQAPAALASYRAALDSQPDNYAVLRHYAAALLRTGDYGKARGVLRNALRRYPQDPPLYQMAATAAAKSNALYDAHRALAEYHYLRGDPSAALEQLRIARRQAGDDFYRLASTDARTQEIKVDVEQWTKDSRK